MATDPSALIQQLVNAGGNIAQQFTAGQDRSLQQAQAAQQLQAGAMQIQQAQAAQQQAQQYQADTAAWVAHGSRPDELPALAAKYPQQAKALQDAWKMKNDNAKAADLDFFGNTQAALANGATDLALNNLRQRRDAEAKAGQNTEELDYLIDSVKNGGQKGADLAKGVLLGHIYSADPDKYADVFGIGKDKGDHFTNTPQGDIYNRATGEITHQGTGKPIIRTVNGQIVQVYPDGTTADAPHPSAANGEQLEQMALAAVPGATVTSRSRTPEHNAAVGGVPNSYHLTDQARDLVPPAGMSMTAFHAQLAAAMPGVKVLNEGDHVHIQPVGPAPRFNAGGTKVLYTAPPKAATDDQRLDNDTLSMMADQYLAGDKTVFQNLGRGAQGGGNVVRLRQMVAQRAKANGMSGSQIAAQMADFTGTMAAERAAGTRTANVELASTEAQRLIPLALQASDALPRSSFLPFAKAQQAISSGVNDPALRRFVTANNALVNVYSRAISPTGQPTVNDKEHARELLNTAYDQASYRAVVGQMQKEIAAARAAPRDVRSDLRGQVSSGGRVPTALPPDIAAILKKYGH